MTAHRVVTEHGELDGIGSNTHDQLDAHVANTNFLVVSGTLPPNARRIRAGTGVYIVDGGPGGDLVVSSTASGSSGGTTVVVHRQTAWMEVLSGSADGYNTSFSLSFSPDPPEALMFYVNGVLQKPGMAHDYVLSGSGIATTYPPGSGSNLVATYQYSPTPSGGLNTSWMETPSGDADGVNMVYSISNSPVPASALMFYVNGVLQMQGLGYDYVLSGTTIAMFYAPGSGSNVLATYPY